jgi:hypothetical protein
MTFIRQVQSLFERTYSPTGINLEDYLIGGKRCRELVSMASTETNELSMDGCTFLRLVDGKLHVAIYYHPAVIRALEDHHPLQVLNQHNIRPLIVFLEELNHAVHASLLFLEGRLDMHAEESLIELELMGKIDTYLTLKFLVAGILGRNKLSSLQRKWIMHVVFKEESFQYRSDLVRRRYRTASELGWRFVAYLEGLKKSQRVQTIRDFRGMSYQDKTAYLQGCSGRLF